VRVATPAQRWRRPSVDPSNSVGRCRRANSCALSRARPARRSPRALTLIDPPNRAAPTVSHAPTAHVAWPPAQNQAASSRRRAITESIRSSASSLVGTRSNSANTSPVVAVVEATARPGTRTRRRGATWVGPGGQTRSRCRQARCVASRRCRPGALWPGMGARHCCQSSGALGIENLGCEAMAASVTLQVGLENPLDLGPEPTYVNAGVVLLTIRGCQGRPVTLDGRATRLPAGEPAVLSVDLKTSTGFHRLAIGPDEFWFATADAKLGLDGVTEMLNDMAGIGTGWSGQILFSDGALLRDPTLSTPGSSGGLMTRSWRLVQSTPSPRAARNPRPRFGTRTVGELNWRRRLDFSAAVDRVLGSRSERSNIDRSRSVSAPASGIGD
jgi:hypothetical protein